MLRQMWYRAKTMAVTLIFPSGDRFTGATATEALAQLAKTQWTPQARADIKRALAWRAFTLRGGDPSIHEFLPDEEFVDALGQAGIIEVERT